MVSWEYKVFTIGKGFWSGKEKKNSEQLLDELGRDGWELISVVPLSQMGGGTTTNLQFFFKRKRF